MNDSASARTYGPRGVRSAALVLAIAAGTLLATNRKAGADGAQQQLAAFNERCANRLSIAFTGKAATAAQLTAADPKQMIEGLLSSGDFQEQFARFINSEFNDIPGPTGPSAAPYFADAPYLLTKQVLSTGGQWSDMFLGQYQMVSIFSNPSIKSDPNGLGYFRVDEWYKRYEGNEPAGIKIATAYRIMNNVVGLRLTASTGNPSVDQTANGRHSMPCSQCHYDNWYALDKVASILPTKGQAYSAYTGGPKEMLGGQMIGSDKDLVTALVASENFSVNACRLAFKYLYGRTDNKCEGPLLDKCVDKFKADKTMQSALSLIAHDVTFCE